MTSETSTGFDTPNIGRDAQPSMYVGRFVVVGPGIGAYRVSSRSFPHRQVVDRDGTLSVVPTPDAPETDNPYVSYNCVRTVEGPSRAPGAVIGNGSHVDPIAEKLDLGYPARDALASGLLAMDYEKDDYDTPRIAGVIESADSSEDADASAAHIGIVRRDALLIEAVSEPALVATYERDAPGAFEFDAQTADDAAREAYDLEFEHAVCAAGVSIDDGELELAVANK